MPGRDPVEVAGAEVLDGEKAWDDPEAGDMCWASLKKKWLRRHHPLFDFPAERPSDSFSLETTIPNLLVFLFLLGLHVF